MAEFEEAAAEAAARPPLFVALSGGDSSFIHKDVIARGLNAISDLVETEAERRVLYAVAKMLSCEVRR